MSMKNIVCNDCNLEEFRVSKSKTTMQLKCTHCDNIQVYYTEEWL